MFNVLLHVVCCASCLITACFYMILHLFEPCMIFSCFFLTMNVLYRFVFLHNACLFACFLHVCVGP